jgi:putative transposase
VRTRLLRIIAPFLPSRRLSYPQAIPLICNSDQGSHFTSPQYLDQFLAIQIKISIDGWECARGAIFTERLCSPVKYVEAYLHNYTSPKDAYLGLSLFTYFYDSECPNQVLDNLTTAQVYGVGLPVVNSTCQVEPVETLTN